MDFDPSEFLAMAMSEDQGTIYTAPDVPEPHSSVMVPAPNMLTVEGGLQIEQGLQIPVPTFGMLDDGFCGVENGFSDSHCESPENDTPTLIEPSQPSPVDRTASPLQTGKKIIHATFEETRFRRDFYNGNYERVKLFRLHCTICDKHLGCAPNETVRQMRIHKLLSVSVCRKCHEFYGDVNFPIEDESEVYCCWCGQGGQVFCCAPPCPKTVCKKCVLRNFGESKVKEIELNDDWKCFVCNPVEIYPHRAMFWGLQRYGKEMRQRAVSLEKEEKNQYLSTDTSQCCQNVIVQRSAISLPFKSVMSKIPLCLIAEPHQTAVKNQPNTPPAHFIISANNNTHIKQDTIQHNNQRLPQAGNTLTMNSMPQRTSLLMDHLRLHQRTNHPASPVQQVVQRGAIKKMPVPFPASRQTNPPPYLAQPSGNVAVNQVPRRSVQAPEVINLVENSPPKQYPQPIQANYTDANISWLEKGVNDVHRSLTPIKLMIDQFNICKDELKKDFTKLSIFSDKLSHNIKIGICNLAKVNQDMVEARKIAIDDQVNSVISSIKASVVTSGAHTRDVERIPPSAPVSHRPPPSVDEEPAATSQVDEDMSCLPAALLCETVMEVEGNKENENSNKHSMTPKKKSLPKPHSVVRGKSSLNIRKKAALLRQPIPVIDLSDDEDEFDVAYYCKKFKITPCQVVLTRCNPIIIE